MGDLVQEGAGLDMQDDLGRDGNRPEAQERGMDRTGHLDRGSGSTPPNGGCNVSGGLRLPLEGIEPLNQPSGNTPL